MDRILKSVAILLLLFVGACNGNSSDTPAGAPEKAEPVVGVFLYNAQDVYVGEVLKKLKAGFPKSFKIVVEDGQGDQLTQSDQLSSLLAHGVDVIVFNPVEPQVASSVIAMAKKADVPIIFFNREPNLDVMKEYPKAAFVGTLVSHAGRLQGEIIHELWLEHPEFDRNGDGKLQYIMFQGEPDNPEAMARTEQSVKIARELGVPLEQVDHQLCGWERKAAVQAMQLSLAVDAPVVELVISNNDAMALGAIDALQQKGYNLEGGSREKFIPVVGVDAVPEAVEAIRKGIMSATIKQDGDEMARVIIALAVNAYEGRELLEGTQYSWDASGVAVRIPYSKFKPDMEQ